MKASVTYLCRNMKQVLAAVDRGEPVEILYRGKTRAVMHPAGYGSGKAVSIKDHPAFGMWKDRTDMRDVGRYVRNLRKPRASVVIAGRRPPADRPRRP